MLTLITVMISMMITVMMMMMLDGSVKITHVVLLGTVPAHSSII